MINCTKPSQVYEYVAKKYGDIQVFIEDQTEESCLDAVERDWRALQFCKVKTEYLCKRAVDKNYKAIAYVPPEFYDVYTIALNLSNGDAIKYMTTWNSRYNYLLVKLNWKLIKYIADPDPVTCIRAVSYNWRAIKLLPYQTDEICLAAVSSNWRALKYVKKQNELICKLALKQSILASKYCNEGFLEPTLVTKLIKLLPL